MIMAEGAYLNHVGFVVADLDRTREFYLDVLGFEEILRPTDFVFRGAYFRLGGAELHVIQEKTPGRLANNSPHWEVDELQTGSVHHVAIMVDSFFPYLEALQKRGMNRVGGFRVRDDYVEQVYIADPDGNVIELMHQLDESSGRSRRQQIYDEGSAVPVGPGHPLIDPREVYGES